jgi:hypothetical protein
MGASGAEGVMSLNTITAKRRCEAATVRLPRRGGQGVLVPGNLIVTAAHVVGWTAEGAMVDSYSSPFPEPIKAGEHTFTVDVLAVEPRADIAVLGALDYLAYPDESEAFEAWCDTTAPARLYTENLPIDESIRRPEGLAERAWRSVAQSVWIPAHILTHDKEWIEAKAQQIRRDSSFLVIKSSKWIEGGTSGGPVIADDGRLLGVISTSARTSYFNAPGEYWLEQFPIPRPHRAAPVWTVAKMTSRRR